MRVTWTVKVAGYSGQQMLCRNEEEAARMVLQLILAGVRFHQIIVDGKNQEKADKAWIWKALGA